MNFPLFFTFILLSSLALGQGKQRLFQPGEIVAFTMTDSYKDELDGYSGRVQRVESGKQGETIYVLKRDFLLVTDIAAPPPLGHEYLPTRYSVRIDFTNRTPGKIVEFYKAGSLFQGNGRILNVPGVGKLKGLAEGDLVHDRRLPAQGVPAEARQYRAIYGEDLSSILQSSILGFTSEGLAVVGSVVVPPNSGESQRRLVVYEVDPSWLKKRRALTVCNDVLSTLLRMR